jgi:GNAT superfamily N-acetyltransferase
MAGSLTHGGHDGPVSARTIELHHGDHLISTDPARVDVEAVHRWLSEEAYWAVGRTVETQRRAIEHSALVVGAYDASGGQVGFARMVTDLATFAWLADVYVVALAQGTGLGTAMVETIVEHPDVVSVARQLLATRDAHDLYARFGYERLTEPDRWMVRRGPV